MDGWDDKPSRPDAGLRRPDQDDDWSLTPPRSPAAVDAGAMPETDAGPPTSIPLAEDPEPEALLAALRSVASGGPPRLDAGAVRRLSMPALQVLLAAMRDVEAAGSRLVIQNPSFALSLAFEAFGFTGPDEPFTVEYT